MPGIEDDAGPNGQMPSLPAIPSRLPRSAGLMPSLPRMSACWSVSTWAGNWESARVAVWALPWDFGRSRGCCLSI